MKTRTALYLCNNGEIRCTCGSVSDFAEDIKEFIIPILYYDIIAIFNERRITVTKYDNVEGILNKFRSVW